MHIYDKYIDQAYTHIFICIGVEVGWVMGSAFPILVPSILEDKIVCLSSSPTPNIIPIPTLLVGPWDMSSLFENYIILVILRYVFRKWIQNTHILGPGATTQPFRVVWRILELTSDPWLCLYPYPIFGPIPPSYYQKMRFSPNPSLLGVQISQKNKMNE